MIGHQWNKNPNKIYIFFNILQGIATPFFCIFKRNKACLQGWRAIRRLPLRRHELLSPDQCVSRPGFRTTLQVHSVFWATSSRPTWRRRKNIRTICRINQFTHSIHRPTHFNEQVSQQRNRKVQLKEGWAPAAFMDSASLRRGCVPELPGPKQNQTNDQNQTCSQKPEVLETRTAKTKHWKEKNQKPTKKITKYRKKTKKYEKNRQKIRRDPTYKLVFRRNPTQSDAPLLR